MLHAGLTRVQSYLSWKQSRLQTHNVPTSLQMLAFMIALLPICACQPQAARAVACAHTYVSHSQSLQLPLSQSLMMSFLTWHVCRIPGFSPAQLSQLTCLEELLLEQMELTDFDVPCTWRKLRVLALEGNFLTQLPKNLEALASLVRLDVHGQLTGSEGLQIRSEMHFLTLLQNLSEVNLSQDSDSILRWDITSQYALMQGRLFIENTPDCKVDLID